MDRAGFEATVTREIKIWQESESTQPVYSLKFQNHLYGCFSVLEYLGEGAFEVKDSSDGDVFVAKDSSGSVFNPFLQFRLVGSEFGFLPDPRAFFDSWSDSYRNAWIWAWKTFGSEKKLDEIDQLETALFAIVQDHGLSYFKDAIQAGQLSLESEKKALELLEKPERKLTHEKEGGTRRAKRAVTPIARRKRFRKTRKLLNSDNLVVKQTN